MLIKKNWEQGNKKDSKGVLPFTLKVLMFIMQGSEFSFVFMNNQVFEGYIR